VAIARLLIQKPDIIVLDEATSALDPPSQEKLMQLIGKRLPESRRSFRIAQRSAAAPRVGRCHVQHCNGVCVSPSDMIAFSFAG
jgi:ABC-type uncharacterized transport system fused permease/ATPase subunit